MCGQLLGCSNSGSLCPHCPSAIRGRTMALGHLLSSPVGGCWGFGGALVVFLFSYSLDCHACTPRSLQSTGESPQTQDHEPWGWGWKFTYEALKCQDSLTHQHWPRVIIVVTKVLFSWYTLATSKGTEWQL